MSSNQEFNITINGSDYSVSTGLKSFYIADVTGGNLRVITDEWGDCNPLESLWGDWKYQTTHGAARESMELKCIRNAVEQAVEAHRDFYIENAED